MRSGTILILLMVWSIMPLSAQDVVNVFLIARTTGTKVLANGDSVRVFGFAEDLGTQPAVPGPTIYAREGDSVHIDLWNVSQGAPHTIHLHGLDVDQANDGVPHLSFDIPHMQHGFYHFKAPHAGTYLYHCHVASTIHVQAGMYGLVIIKAAGDSGLTWTGGYPFDREFNFLFSEIDTLWHSNETLDHPHGNDPEPIRIPIYDPEHFLINGLENQQLDPEQIRLDKNESALLRFANIGFYSNKLVFPEGLNAQIISSDGRPLPSAYFADSLIIYPGERYQVLISASEFFEDSIRVYFSDLNTGNIRGLQHIGFSISDLSSEPILTQESLLLYPNPFSQNISIIQKTHRPVHKVEMFDGLGNNVEVCLSDDQLLVPESLAPGVYWLWIYAGETIQVQKLVKI